jgi:hypothetical protein
MGAEPVDIAHPQSEFWTVVTDFVLSAACAVFALRLQRRIHESCDKKPPPPSSKLRAVAAAAGGSVDAARWWARVLWVIALSTLLAAFYHWVDVSERDTSAALQLWKVVLLSIHVAGFCICRSLACMCECR